MSDEWDEIVYEEYAFDQMQQEEAVFFWSVADAVESIETFGAKTWLAAILDSLDDSSRNEIISLVKERNK